MAARYDITIDKGATFSLRLQWKIAGVGVELLTDGWTARMQVRATYDAVDPLLSYTSAGGDIALDDSGRIEVTGPAVDTAALDDMTEPAVWDLEVVNGSTVKRLLGGYAYIKSEATR